MNYIESAIKEAVEKGGWRNNIELPALVDERTAFLDPLFWQALGKARGWAMGGTGKVYHDEYGAGGYPSMYVWQVKWHRFIDHLAAEKSAESFFQELQS